MADNIKQLVSYTILIALFIVAVIVLLVINITQLQQLTEEEQKIKDASEKASHQAYLLEVATIKAADAEAAVVLQSEKAALAALECAEAAHEAAAKAAQDQADIIAKTGASTNTLAAEIQLECAKAAEAAAVAAEKAQAAAVTAAIEATNRVAEAKANAIAALAVRNNYVSFYKTSNVDMTSGSHLLLKDLNVTCGSKGVLTGLQLTSTDGTGANASYNFGCMEHSDFKPEEPKYTNWTDAGKDIRYLDRQTIDCGDSPLNSLKLEVSDDNTKLRYAYRCAKSTLPTKTILASTTPTDTKNNLAVYSLGEQNVQCPKWHSLSKLKMNTQVVDGRTKVLYDYGCTKHV